MNVSAVQEERGPRKPKITSKKILPDFSPLNSETFPYSSPSRLLQTETNPAHELAAQILLVTIKQARCNAGFGLLNRFSQNTILGNLWAPLFLLRAAHWPSENVNMFPGVENTFITIKKLKLDSTDLELVENILLCRTDLLDDVEQIVLAENILMRALDGLAIRSALDRRRFTDVLLALPVLFIPSAIVLHSLLFKPHEKTVSVKQQFRNKLHLQCFSIQGHAAGCIDAMNYKLRHRKDHDCNPFHVFLVTEACHSRSNAAVQLCRI
ncbi:hypothetical protein Zmor_014180 [Zophobas morio]|uniref:NR LBD domain-containing protein n=1 Tax=Zophobas morio TaxID=2755281 RepID=A0AA38IET0_9CUCU|nr:hypothetical protein Zmor_014180 [Zophobas morio]